MKISNKQIEEFVRNNKCPKCKSITTTEIIKTGKRSNVKDDMQVFYCKKRKDNKHYFSIPLEELAKVQERVKTEVFILPTH